MEHDKFDFSTIHLNFQKGKQSSPINFFSPNIKKYPFWKNVDKLRLNLKPGDCVFIPAYHYY